MNQVQGIAGGGFFVLAHALELNITDDLSLLIICPEHSSYICKIDSIVSTPYMLASSNTSESSANSKWLTRGAKEQV
jgi:hypothetical protein